MPNRRDVLLASGALTLAAAASLAPSRAQEGGGSAASADQVPGFYRYRIGEMILTALNDGVNAAPLEEGFVTNVGLDEVASALEAAFLPRDTIPITFSPLLIQNGGETILVDTGMGEGDGPGGRLFRNMEAAGISPSGVTKVLITHFHGDHISGIRNAAGELQFPNAEILVPEPEWAFWMDDGNLASAPEGRRGNFELVRKIFADTDNRRTAFGWDEEVLPGITSVDARGHTPGHTAFTVASGEDSILLLGDTTNHPALFVRHPDWAVRFDMDAELARTTRRRLLDMAAADRLQVSGFHYPFPATGHIAKQGSGFEYVPLQWSPTL